MLGCLRVSRSGGLWQPVADTCGPYKKISDQICSILPCLLAAWALALLLGLGGQNLGSLWQPVAGTCGPYEKIIDQICSILLCLLEA